MQGDPPTFDYDPKTPYSPRLMCSVCGRKGFFAEARYTHSWMTVCRRGHAPCSRCGKPLSLKLDGTPRVHSRCPKR